MSKALTLLTLFEEVQFSTEENEDGFTIVATLNGEQVGNVVVVQEYVGSGGDGYPFEPYKAEPFYKDLIDNDFVINVQHLHVDKNHRAKGVATQLMDKAMTEISNQFNGVPVYINASPIGLDISLDNLTKFYQKFGFKLLKSYPEHSNALMWHNPMQEKTLAKAALLGLAAAGALGGAMHKPAPEPTKQVQQKPNPLSLFPKEMAGIIKQESQNGKYIKHKTVTYGLNKGDTAAGFTGMMPKTARDIIAKNKMKEYEFLLKLTNDEITAYLNEHPEAEAAIATKHWARISKIFKSPEKRIFAWNQGITGALKASPEQVAEHPYVQKVKGYSDMKVAAL